MNIAERAAEYVGHGWPIAPINEVREDGTVDLAGPVMKRTQDARLLWSDHPYFGVALYCATDFAVLELPAFLGAPLHRLVGSACPTLQVGTSRWRFVVSPHDDLHNHALLGVGGRLRCESVFVPIAPLHTSGLARVLRRGEWLVHPRDTLWSPGDPQHLAINLQRLHKSAPARGRPAQRAPHARAAAATRPASAR